MGFPSPAADYVENRISLDLMCNTHGASVYFFRAASASLRAGIKKDAVLIVNSALKAVDGSIIAAQLKGEFKLVRYRLNPEPHLEELSNPEQRLPLLANEVEDMDTGMCFGVVTHCLNNLRTEEFDAEPFLI